MESDDPLIVVIDDDESLCRALVRVLSNAAYQVRTYNRAADYLADGGTAGCVSLDSAGPPAVPYSRFTTWHWSIS